MLLTACKFVCTRELRSSGLLCTE